MSKSKENIMKNMSFGKLMAIFGGSLVVVIILAVVIIKATSGPKPGSTVVTQRHQTEFQPQQPVILADQLRREQEASAAAREMSAQRAQAMQQALQQQNQAVMQRLDGMYRAEHWISALLRLRTAAVQRACRSSNPSASHAPPR